MKTKSTFLVIILILFSLNGWSQEKSEELSINPNSDKSRTQVNLNRTIYFKNDSKTEEVIIKIENKTRILSLAINSKVATGKLFVEVYDPSGKKQGNFGVGTQLGLNSEDNSLNREEVYGSIVKRINEPQVGNWKVILKSVEATATVKIQTQSVQ